MELSCDSLLLIVKSKLIPDLQVERLFEKPDREIQMPTATKERTVRAPAEMMKNVQGSSAGAGSGEFHVYKQSRRREYERLKIMEDKNRAVSNTSVSLDFFTIFFLLPVIACRVEEITLTLLVGRGAETVPSQTG